MRYKIQAKHNQGRRETGKLCICCERKLERWKDKEEPKITVICRLQTEKKSATT